MKIVLFSHPTFMASQSMPRFTSMLRDAYLARGHQVQVWAPEALFYRITPNPRLKKWSGYLDQYIVFPISVMRKRKLQPRDTLYVFTDQALGPWVPRVSHCPHVVHVHDLLALRSAFGEVPEHPTSWTGRIYQHFIRQGFRHGKHFISISNKTRDDLTHYGDVDAITSEVVYNGLNYPYTPLSDQQVRMAMADAKLPMPEAGMLLHVSGNQWYKNVSGVVRMYAHYARNQSQPLPLWLIGDINPIKLQQELSEVPSQGKVLFFKGLSNQALQACYSVARALLFPSLAEGFGWPLIEAQACGCPVITTNEPPMTEAAGPHACYLPRLKASDDKQAWAENAAAVLTELLNMSPVEAQKLRELCAAWPQKFGADAAIEGYLGIYKKVLSLANEIPPTASKGKE